MHLVRKGGICTWCKHLANPARLARAFELGQIGGVEGFEIIGLLEAELTTGYLVPGGKSLLVLLAAYREALTFGGRQNVYALGEAIARELKDAHRLLEKIRVRVGMNQPALFGSSTEISAFVTQELRRRTDQNNFAQMRVGDGQRSSDKTTGIKAAGEKRTAWKKIKKVETGKSVDWAKRVWQITIKLEALKEYHKRIGFVPEVIESLDALFLEYKALTSFEPLDYSESRLPPPTPPWIKKMNSLSRKIDVAMKKVKAHPDYQRFWKSYHTDDQGEVFRYAPTVFNIEPDFSYSDGRELFYGVDVGKMSVDEYIDHILKIQREGIRPSPFGYTP